jgi:hypothetical protein
MNRFVARTACALPAFFMVAGAVFAQEAKPEEKKEEPKTTVDSSKGGVSFKSGNNSLTLGARLQVRWTGEDREDYDSDTIGAGKGVADGFSSGFDVARMRLTLKAGCGSPGSSTSSSTSSPGPAASRATRSRTPTSSSRPRRRPR